MLYLKLIKRGNGKKDHKFEIGLPREVDFLFMPFEIKIFPAISIGGSAEGLYTLQHSTLK